MDQVAEHERECHHAWERCPFEGCNTWASRGAMAQHLRESLAEHLLMTQRELREARAEQKVMQLQLEVTQGQLLHTREELQEVQGQLSALQVPPPPPPRRPSPSSSGAAPPALTLCCCLNMSAVKSPQGTDSQSPGLPPPPPAFAKTHIHTDRCSRSKSPDFFPTLALLTPPHPAVHASTDANAGRTLSFLSRAAFAKPSSHGSRLLSILPRRYSADASLLLTACSL